MSNERSPRRKNEQLNNDVMDALEKEILQHGFINVKVNNLLHDAKIQPNVFYNRYESLDKLLDEYVGKYNFWLNDVLNITELEHLGPRKFYAEMLKKIFVRLVKEPVMQKILIWELSENNVSTRRTADIRDTMTSSLNAYYKSIFKSSGIDISTITAIFFAGVYYLVLQRERSTVLAVDFNTDKGQKLFSDAIDTLTGLLFDKVGEQQEKYRMIRKMLDDKIPMSKISEYLDLPVRQLEKIVSLNEK